MIIDPVQALAAVATSVGPLPTVVPVPSVEYQEATDSGNRTLWYVFLSSQLSMLSFIELDKLVVRSSCRVHFEMTQTRRSAHSALQIYSD